MMALLITAIAGASGAHAETSGPSEEFRKFDTNADGYISRVEAKRVRDFDKALVEADDDRDGRLDPDEFIKAQSVHERMQAGQYLADTMVTAKVKAALLKDMQLTGLDIEVETYEGKVQLSGYVDTKSQVRRAAEVAASISGVTAVTNSLLVKS